MSLFEWLAAFREQHERARRGQLGPRDLAAYRARRDELARALVAAQRLTMKPGETPRRALRVARALKLELQLEAAVERTVTLDVSTGGFSCMLQRSPALGAEVAVSLRLPAAEPVVTRARMSDAKPAGTGVRVAFSFPALTEAERERIETFVFDTILAQLA